MSQSASELFIVDNSDSDWKVRSYLSDWCELSSAIDIATGYFEIGALLCLKEQWQKVDRIRILMGDEVSLKTKRAFSEGLRKVAHRLSQGEVPRQVLPDTRSRRSRWLLRPGRFFKLHLSRSQ